MSCRCFGSPACRRTKSSDPVPTSVNKSQAAGGSSGKPSSPGRLLARPAAQDSQCLLRPVADLRPTRILSRRRTRDLRPLSGGNRQTLSHEHGSRKGQEQNHGRFKQGGQRVMTLADDPRLYPNSCKPLRTATNQRRPCLDVWLIRSYRMRISPPGRYFGSSRPPTQGF